MLRRGNHHSAKFWRWVLLPVMERYQRLDVPKFFRGDAAFAEAWLARRGAGGRTVAGRGGDASGTSQELGLSAVGDDGESVCGGAGGSANGAALADDGPAVGAAARGQPAGLFGVGAAEFAFGGRVAGVVNLLLASGTREKAIFVLEQPREALREVQAGEVRDWDPRLSATGTIPKCRLIAIRGILHGNAHLPRLRKIVSTAPQSSTEAGYGKSGTGRSGPSRRPDRGRLGAVSKDPPGPRGKQRACERSASPAEAANAHAGPHAQPRRWPANAARVCSRPGRTPGCTPRRHTAAIAGP